MSNESTNIFLQYFPRAEIIPGRDILAFAIAPFVPTCVFAVAAFLWGGFDFLLLLSTFSMGMMTITPLCYVAAVLFGVPAYWACLRWTGRMSIWFCLIGGTLIGEVFASVVVMGLDYASGGPVTWRWNAIFPLTGLIAGAAFWCVLRGPSSNDQSVSSVT